MDPNTALAEILAKLDQVDKLNTDTPEGQNHALSLFVEIGWSFDGLNEWIMRGGALPDAWAAAQAKTRR
jgi:hypothetical protein